MAVARLEKFNGSPAIVVDGRVYPPMTMTVRRAEPDPDYIKRLGEAGMKIFYIPCRSEWIDSDGPVPEESPALEEFSRKAADLLKVVPDAWIMLRLTVEPTPEWCEKHPDHVMCFQDGSTKPVITHSLQPMYRGMYCICSDLWRKEAAVSLERIMTKLDNSPYADRIIGYFLASGGTNEWYNPCVLTDFKNGLYGDCSPAFRAYYSDFLRRKYRTDADLRKAWNREDVSLDNPPIPPLEERKHMFADDVILDALLHYEDAERMVGKSIDNDPHSATHHGVFLNPDTAQDCADYYNAFHTGVAESIIHLGQVVRKHYGKTRLVGAFYGSYGCTEYYDTGTAEAVVPIINSGAVDFLAAPGNYDNREPGGYVSQREMQDSFRLHNMMFIVEEDARTCHSELFYQDSMEQFSTEDSLNTLKREFGRNICQDMQAWWFDMALKGEYWYDDPAILQLFRRQQEVGEYAYSIPRAKGCEIACIYDQESIHYTSILTNRQMLDYFRTTDMNRIGTGMDYYYHNDLLHPDMPDYKMYLVINAFAMTAEERSAMKEKFARNGAVVVFLYASGFIKPDAAGSRIGVEHMEDLIGMKIGRFEGTHSPRYKLLDGFDDVLPLAEPDRIYGVPDRVVRSNVWLGNSSTAPFMNPGFYIDDDSAIVLGRYGLDGKAALAMKKQPEGWTSIFSAPQYLRSELVAGFARYAGCHLFTHSDDCVYANRNFLTIHGNRTGNRTLYFPEPCSPYEVYEQKYYGENVSEIEIFIRRGETKMFCLTGGGF